MMRKPKIIRVRGRRKTTAPDRPEIAIQPAAPITAVERDPLADDEPWPDPVNGAELLDELSAIIQKYVVLPAVHHAEAIALWIVHTYAINAFWLSPILAITSPDKRCGKSTLLMLLEALCRRPLISSSITSASLARTVDRDGPTLLIDEADRFAGTDSELWGTLNAGHTRRTAYRTRCDGKDNEARRFCTFGAKAIAQIGKLTGTLADRSVAIDMVRKTDSEPTARLRQDRIFTEVLPLRQRAARWSNDHSSVLAAADPEVPRELHDRAQDNWRPLLAIADVAGETWPVRSRAAALALSADEDPDDEESRGVQVLADIREILQRLPPGPVPSDRLVRMLCGMSDRPWSEYAYGKALTQRSLALLLGQFSIRPQKMRIGSTTVRGYFRNSFDEAFRRYLPPALQDANELTILRPR